MTKPIAAYLDGSPDGRLHLQHGPIDLVIGVDGGPRDTERRLRARAFAAAEARFATILAELVDELAILKSPAGPGARLPTGTVARRMAAAVAPYAADLYITPMAAVAGAVADEMVGAMLAAFTGELSPSRLYANNGGDIALHLAPGSSFSLAIAREDGVGLGRFTVRDEAPTRGVATSGRGGRSLTMGIADSVTVLAATAAEADAAATVVGNSVDLPGHPSIRRRPANVVVDDSDLRDLPVVVGVGPLRDGEIAAALDAGEATAGALIARRLIHRAALVLGRQGRVCEPARRPITVPETAEVAVHA